ncbi:MULTISPECIES: hypothetical protein [Methanobacterium]|nr:MULTISPECIES: hypothetical protein [Methanobacterium]
MVNRRLSKELQESEEYKKWTEKVNEILAIMSRDISKGRKQELLDSLTIDLLFISIILGTVYPMSELMENWDRSVIKLIK